MGAYEGPTNFLNVGAAPSLMLNFAREKSLEDQISGKDLITFLRSSVGTYVGADGLIKTAAVSEARFDHDPNGNCLGLLVEEQRTNLYTQSSDMYSSYWGPVNLIRTPNATIAPDGTNTATLLVANTTNGTHTIKPNIAISTSFNTVSVFLKSNGDQYFMIRGDNQSNFCVFDLINGVIASSSTLNSTTASIMEYPNGWYKCIVSYIPAGVGNDPEFYLANSSTYNTASFSGTGANGVYIWGAQLEAGAFPTSYIPTSGSQVTRQPDIAQITGTNFTDWYNATEGTIFTEFSAKGSNTAGYPGVYWFNNNLTASRGFALLKETGPQTRVFQRGDDVVLKRVSFSENIPDSTFAKASVFYTNSEIGGSQNNEFQSPTSITSPYSVNRLYIGYHNSGGGVAPLHLNSHIKQLIYYPARISDIKLQQMTKVFS